MRNHHYSMNFTLNINIKSERSSRKNRKWKRISFDKQRRRSVLLNCAKMRTFYKHIRLSSELHCTQFERSRISCSEDVIKNLFIFNCAHCAHLRTFSKNKYAELLSLMRRSFGVMDLKIEDVRPYMTTKMLLICKKNRLYTTI